MKITLKSNHNHISKQVTRSVQTLKLFLKEKKSKFQL